MQKISGAIVLSVAAIAGAATLVLSRSNSDADQSAAARVANHFDTGAATEERILALEAAVSEERQARQLLEEELLILMAKMDKVSANREDAAAADEAVAEDGVTAESEPATRRLVSREERKTTARRDALIEAGMSPDRAEYVLRRESEMRYEQMQAVFEARNSGEPLDPFDRSFSADAMLRNEIGDAEYEMYLAANNRPTSVGVSSVMASSPGERAGLQAGDQIVGYDGERVFSATELMQRTMAGGDGNVVLDVMRDDSLMQIIVPRGPIGVEIGRFRGR